METNEVIHLSNLDVCQIYTYNYKPMNKNVLGLIGFFIVLVLPVVTFFVFDYRGILLYFIFGGLYVLFFFKRQRIDRARQLTVYFRDEHSHYYRIRFVTSMVITIISGDVRNEDLEKLNDKEFLYHMIQEHKKGNDDPDISVHYLDDFAIHGTKNSNVVFTYYENQEEKKIKLSKRYFTGEE